MLESDSFNFDQDITTRIISSPLPLESMKGILVPFMNVQQTKQWSLLTIFSEQNIKEERKTLADEGFMELSEEETKEYQEMLAKQYVQLMEGLLEAMGEREIDYSKTIFSVFKRKWEMNIG